MRVGRSVVACAVAAALAIGVAPGCSLGSGTGSCTGTLDVPDCWSGPFDLHPDFFAAVPSANSPALQIRLQRGNDYETFSDGLLILVDDVGEIRGGPAPDGTPRPSLLGQPLVVALPAGVTPPGVPVTPKVQPSIVHATLYLDATCRTQEDALYAVDAVTTNPDGSCSRPEGGDPPSTCPGVAIGDAGADGGADGDATAGADAGADAGRGSDAGSDGGSSAGSAGTLRSSTITFNSLFDGNPNESNASQRLTDATFHFYLADPRDICSGGLGPPPRCRGELKGSFHFYFERGRPAQPFP